MCRYICIGYGMLFLLMGPAILVTPSSADDTDCGYVPVDLCFEKLQTFLKLPSLPFPTDEYELDKLCAEAIGGYDCAVRLQKNPKCISDMDKDLMLVFISMAQYMVLMFCTAPGSTMGYRRDDLLKSSDCILKQKKNLDCCAEQTKLPDLPIMKILDPQKSFKEKQISTCCPLSSYINCAQTVLENSCGKLAANVSNEYIRRASGEQLEAVCQRLPGYPKLNQEVCKISPPVCAGCRTEIFTLLIMMTLFLVLQRNGYSL